MRVLFLTVTDGGFFPGTVATVHAVRAFHPEAAVWVVENDVDQPGLSAAQRAVLASAGARLVRAEALARPGRKLAAWELKAYAAADLTGECDVLVGIDSDCVLCGRVDDLVAMAVATGAFVGGADAAVEYDERYGAYGLATPARNERYMSTSLYACALTAANRAVLGRWAGCCAEALFGGGTVYPGHGDQGVLNAVLFAERGEASARVLENRLWSQHHCYWTTRLTLREGRLFNEDAQAWQRALHCGGTDKFWSREHAARVARDPARVLAYAWYLRHLWLGPGRVAPELLGGEQAHLAEGFARWRYEVLALAGAGELAGRDAEAEPGAEAGS